VEGFKFAAFPKIELHRAALENTLLYPDDPDIFAVVSDHSLAQKEHPPVLPLDDLDAIADFVLGRAEPAPPASVRLSEELVLHFRLLRVNGCNDSHSGNASALVDNGFWLTRAGACADTLISKDLLHCPLEGTCPVGTPDDALIHRQVYSQQPKARAVLHSHGPYSVAMSFAGQDFRPADFQAQYYFESVPVLNVPYEDYMDEAPQAVAEALAEHPICMVRGHGVYAWGETINIAYKWTTSLELSAKTYVIARQAASL
jgi:L-fuculose-phosphate aldolase